MKKLLLFIAATLMSVGLFAQTIGPKEEITITYGCVGEHYQVLGGGNGASWRTVGNSDNYTITVESLNGEIIDNLRLEVYFPSKWTGYSISSTSGTVSGDVASYQDLVVTNINATSVTLSRAGEGDASGSVSFSKIIVNDGISPEPIDVTCKSWDFEDWGDDGELYLYNKDTTLAFYFDLYYGEGAEDLIPGKEYTVADIYVEEGEGQYAGVFHDDDWYYGIKTLSLTKTIDEGGLVHFVGSLVDSLDVAYTFHYDQPEPKEPVVVAILFPTENVPTTVEIATSNDQWESGAAMELLENGWHMNSEIEAYADDTLIFRDANNHETVLCQYVPANGNGDGKWEVVKLVFGDEWTDDTWKGDPVKFIELELNNAAEYAWTVAGTTGINDVEGNNAQIFGSNQRIVINNAANATVAVYDVMGRTVVKEQRINTNNAVFAMPQRGMYIVRMGKAAKKVWVR